MFDMSFIYIIVAFVAVIFNNAIVETVPLAWRINFGYVISLITLVLIALLEVCNQSLSHSIGETRSNCARMN